MMRKKLKNKKGETLVETLIAVLICCLAMAALSSVMASAGNMMHSAEEHYEAYYARNSVISNPGSESGTSGTVAVTSAGTPLKLSPDADAGGIDVEYYVNTEAGEKNTVTVYYLSESGSAGGT